jgi:curli production assembly/transport component CsgG
MQQAAGKWDKPQLPKNRMEKELDSVPPPAKGRISVAVYSFQDKTGQRKQVPGIASFSTAVTQGADALLIRALQDVGHGQWFDVVERTNIDDLTKERLIIKQMRDAYEGPNAQKLMPLQFAGMLIEGGIIGYDSGTESGGTGYNWLGIGPTTQYSRDVVTVSLRAVSVNTGKILATTTVTKVILSTSDTLAIFKSLDPGGDLLSQITANNSGSNSPKASIFQFETGITINEATTLAIKSTVESAVVELIREGERKHVWDYKEGYKAAEPVPVENFGRMLGTVWGTLLAPARAPLDVVGSFLGGDLGDGFDAGYERTDPRNWFVKPVEPKCCAPVKPEVQVSVDPVKPDARPLADPTIPLGMSRPADTPADQAAKAGVIK